MFLNVNEKKKKNINKILDILNIYYYTLVTNI